MSRVSPTRTLVVAVTCALVLGACGQAASVPAGTGGSTVGGTGGEGPAGTGGAMAVCGVLPTTGAPGFGAPAMGGAGTSTEKYLGVDVTRDDASYRFITNWWGQGWTAADVSYE